MAERLVIKAGVVRWSGAVWVALFLFWLPFEDVGVTTSLGLAALGALWLLLRWRSGRDRAPLLTWILCGLLLGAAIPLITISLAAFKSGLHAHGFADFSLWQLQSMVLCWGWWLGGGTLAGAVGWTVEQGLNRT